MDDLRLLAAEAAAAGELLRRRGELLATAESCTGGLLGAAVTANAGSSEWYAGGCITYCNHAKADLLGVEAETLRLHGAVSEPTALQMARGAQRALKAHWAVSVTGVAGPGGGTPHKPVGTVWIALARPDGTASARLLNLKGDRSEIRRQTAVAVFGWLKENLL